MKSELTLKEHLLENGLKPMSGPGAKGLLPCQVCTLLHQPYTPPSLQMKDLSVGCFSNLLCPLQFGFVPLYHSSEFCKFTGEWEQRAQAFASET